MAKRKFEVEVTGFGGEYTAGVIGDEEKIFVLKDLSEQLELDFNNFLDMPLNDGTEEINCFEEDNILHSYGVDVENDRLEVIVQELELDKDGEPIQIDNDMTYEYKKKGDILFNSSEGDDINDIRVALFSNPYIDKEKMSEEFGEDAVVLFGVSVEKGLNGSYIIETDGEDFDVKNLFFRTTLMDEISPFNDNVSDGMLYINKKMLDKNIEELKKEEEYKELIPEMMEIYNDFEDIIEDEMQDFIPELVYFFSEKEGNPDYKAKNPSLALRLFNELEELRQFEGYPKGTEAYLYNLDNEEL